jgi:hypothetical protein
MKQLAILWLSLTAAFLSSCTVFIFNEEEHARKDTGDTISIIIAHDIEDNRQ